MSSSIAERIVKSSLVVMTAHLILKVMGFVQTIIIGHYYDKTQTDAFVIAFEGILFMVFLIGEEAIGPAFLPVFSEAKNKESETSAWSFANALLAIQAVLLVGVTLFILARSEMVIQLVNLLSGRQFQAEGTKNVFTVSVLTYMAPGLIGLSLGSTTYMMLNGYKRFFWAAFGDTLVKITVIVSILLFVKIDPVAALGIGLAVGGFAKLAGHLWGLRDKLRLLVTVRPSVMSPAFRKFLVLIAPLILGILFAKLRDFINNIAILNHVRADGVLTANSWGKKIFQTAGWFIPYGISIAMFPYFCDMIDKDDQAALGRFMGRSSRMLLAFFIPFTVGGLVLSLPLCRLLYQHGKFELADWTSVANICYLMVLPFFSLEYFFMQGFFADRRMVAPTVLGIVCSAISILISYAGVILFDVEARFGPVYAIAVVALGFTFSRALKVVLLIGLFNRRIHVWHFGELFRFLARLAVVAAATGGAAWAVRLGCEHWLPVDRRLFLALEIGLAAGIGGLTFVLSAWIMKIDELRTALDWALLKLRKRDGKAGETPA